jgi:hypothetical protein
MQRRHPRSLAIILLSGTISGVIAGSLMALATMIHFAAYGQRITAIFTLIAGTVFGAATFDRGQTSIIVGLLLHLLVSVLLAILFTALVGIRTPVLLVFLAGLLFSIAIWIMTFVVLPWTDPLLFKTFVKSKEAWWLLYHLIYGAGLALSSRIHRYFLPN